MPRRIDVCRIATLSLPQSEARAWLEGQSEQNSTHKSSPTSDPPIRSQNMVATINHEQNWIKREDTNSDTASKRVYAYQGNASDDPMRDSVSASSSKSGAEQPTYSDTNGPKLSDVVGHGPVKLRIKEALLPILLPKQLADSILTGKLNIVSLFYFLQKPDNNIDLVILTFNKQFKTFV